MTQEDYHPDPPGLDIAIAAKTGHVLANQKKRDSSGSRSTESSADVNSTGTALTPTSDDGTRYLLRLQETPAATTAITAQHEHEAPGTSGLSPQTTSLFTGEPLLRPTSHQQEQELVASNLSLSDMYTGAVDESSDMLNQNEYFTYDESLLDTNTLGYKCREFETPPMSLSSTPTGGPKTAPTDSTLYQVADSVKIQPPPPVEQPIGSSLVSHTSMSTSQLTTGTSMASSSESRTRPVLYSAIGSLEDPSSQSYGRWNTKPVASRYDFPSSRLLPPANQVKTRSKTSSKGSKTPKTSNTDASHKSHLSGKLQADGATPGPKRVDNIGIAGDFSVEPLQRSLQHQPKKPSNLRSSNKPSVPEDSKESNGNKKVTINSDDAKKLRRSRKKKGPAEMFRPSSDAYTPRMGKKEIKYKPAELRTPVQQMASPLGTLSRPNFRDALRRVAMIIRQHIVKIERRFESKSTHKEDGLFQKSMRRGFSEECYATPTYKCTMVRVPMARPGMVYGLKKVRKHYEIPSEAEIYEFGHQLFKSVQLSSECSIVCLIYVERLMEIAKVPLLSNTWRPIFMCGLLLASKVWQDLSSWNIEFASVYPQYSLDSINRLELQFLRMVKWDLYISSSEYAKYYFALRSLVEKSDFRQRYNRMVGGVDNVQADEALKIEKRSTMVKEEAILQLSRSM